MAMHMEARRRQMHMDRVCEARRRLALARDNIQTESYARNIDEDTTLYDDQGPFIQNQNEKLQPQSLCICTRNNSDQSESLKETMSLSSRKHNQKSLQTNQCPSSLLDIKRDHIYKILHPYT